MAESLSAPAALEKPTTEDATAAAAEGDTSGTSAGASVADTSVAKDEKSSESKQDEKDTTSTDNEKDLESKVADLSAKLAEVTAKLESNKDAPKPSEPAKEKDDEMVFYGGPEKPPKIIPKLNYAKWLDFKSTYMERTEDCALDVLVGAPVYYWQRSEVRMLLAENDTTSQEDLEKQLKSQVEMPDRMRINSMSIIRMFAMIAWDTDWTLKPTIFLRPYKFLVYYEKDLRQWLRDLNIKWADGPPPTEEKKEEKPEGEKDEEGDAKDKDEKKPDAPADASKKTTDADKKKEEEEKKPEKPDITKNDAHSYESLQALRCLMEFMDTYVFPVARSYREGTPQQIFFRDLWYLYKPGDEVVTYKEFDSKETVNLPQDGTGKSSPTIWKVLQVDNGRPNLRPANSISTSAPLQKINPFSILCYRIGYNGHWFGPITRTFDIQPYDSIKDITSLNPCPAKYVENYEDIKSALMKRGKRFLEFTKPTHQHYIGPTLKFHPGGDECNIAQESPEIESNVVVDFKEAESFDSRWVPKLRHPAYLAHIDHELWERYPRYIWKDETRRTLLPGKEELVQDDKIIDRVAMDDLIGSDLVLSRFNKSIDRFKLEEKDFKDMDLVLLPDRVTAFDLHKRKFSIIAMAGLSNIEVRKDGWNDLKLPRGHKSMLQAQVKSHFRDKRARESDDRDSFDMDLVRGKGQGLIVLLHGAPGVGKTSTAECIAEALRKPLYPITCGDLGITAEVVEENLRQIFARAEAWDCILLLDEADVFLAQRTRTDIKRNAIVSVFLRILEYYRGILILTTNRVGAFDEAFKSRIHLPLYYPVLNREQTLSIWRMNLARVRQRKHENITIDEKDIENFAEKHFDYHSNRSGPWNGRQIRNAIQTAIAMAEYEAVDGMDDWEEVDNVQDVKKPHLKADHFMTVATASDQFDQYISDTIGSTDAERAFADRDRANDLKWAANRGGRRSGFEYGQSQGTWNQGGQPPPADFNSYLQQTQGGTMQGNNMYGQGDAGNQMRNQNMYGQDPAGGFGGPQQNQGYPPQGFGGSQLGMGNPQGGYYGGGAGNMPQFPEGGMGQGYGSGNMRAGDSGMGSSPARGFMGPQGQGMGGNAQGGSGGGGGGTLADDGY